MGLTASQHKALIALQIYERAFVTGSAWILIAIPLHLTEEHAF
jgi:hypothetical protein